ncbi:MAG: hypothetical protein KDE15_06810 [Erythrobacter sp.]|nr:hypothetical protein [Erythrobacter sp.]
MKFRPLPLLAAPLLLLVACSDEDAALSEDDGREASGEVLEGSISDAMLPLEEVQSQAPLAEPEAAPSGGATTAAGEAAEPASEPAESAEAAETTPAE